MFEINVFLDLSFSYENLHILYCHFVLILESNKNINMFGTISSTILKVWEFGAWVCIFWLRFLWYQVTKILLSRIMNDRASLVAQWLRIRLPMQETRVRAMVRGDPTCRGATKPMCHNYWACTLESASHSYWAHAPQLLKPARLEPVLRNKRGHPMRSPHTARKSSPCSLQLEKSPHAATKTQGSQK